MRAVLMMATLVAGAFAMPVQAKLPPCPGGRYLVAGSPILDSDGAPHIDRVDMAGRMVSIASGCGVTKARVTANRRGTRVTARFASCLGITGKALMKGTITDACNSLAATFSVRSLRLVKPFVATLSRCGDGVWDAEGGEECDGALGPCGGLCASCSCGGVTTSTGPTTTSVTTTTDVTSTSGPTTTTTGGTTSTGVTTTTSGSTTTTSGGTTTTSGGTTTTSGGTTTTSGGTTTTGAATTSTTSALPTTTSSTAAVPTTTTTHTTTSTAAGATTSSSTSSSTFPMITTTSTTTTTMATKADLVPVGFSATSNAPAHANVIVGYGVKNQGAVTAIAPWYDYVLWSTDQTFGGDTAVGVFQRLSNLGVNGQYNDNGAQTIQVPNVAAGTYYLYFQTDGSNAVMEGSDANNWTGPIAITVSNADLSPTALTIPASATINVQFSVSYSIKNMSASVPAYGPWNDQLYLSTDASLDGGDTLIGSFSQSGVSANTTYNQTQPVTIPMGVAPGTYYIILKADGANDYYETNEGNNVRVSSGTMSVS